MPDRDDGPLESRSYLPPEQIRQPAARREFKVERIRRKRSSPNAAVLGVISVVLVGLAAVLVGMLMNTRSSQADGQEAAAVAPSMSSTPSAIPVTATPFNPTQTAVLPDFYIVELSATPVPTTPIPEGFSEATPTSAFQPLPTQFSLAGSQMVFVCFLEGHDDLCAMNADGSGYRRITDTPGTDWYPALSSDGQQVVWSSQRGGNFDIWIMNVDGSNARQITRNLGTNFAPDLSPDGSRVVFASTAGTTDLSQNIWAINVDGTGAVQLTDSPFDDIDPTWSPDGTQIVFSSSRSGTTELHVMNADGSNVRQLTEDVHVGGRNDWSPDGQWLTFYAGDAGNKNVYIMDAACAWTQVGCITEPVPLVTEGNSKGPSFSPDSQWIVFAGSLFQGDGDNEIYVVSIDGLTIYKLTNNSYADWQPRWTP